MKPSSLASPVVLLPLVAVLAPCGSDPGALCRSLLERRETERAGPICERAWERTRDPRAGAGAAAARARANDPTAVEAWVARLAGTPHEAEVMVALGRVRVRGGRAADARAAFEKALALGRRLGDHPAAANAAYELFQIAYRDANYLDALSHIEVAEVERAAAGLQELRRPMLGALFDVLYAIGHVDAARRVLAQAAALANPRDPDEMRYVRYKQALMHQVDGSWALERQAYLDALALNARARAARPGLTWNITLNLIQLAAERGDVAEARRYLEEARRHRAGARPGRNQEVALLRRRARVERAAGNTAEARRLLAEARKRDPADEVVWVLATDEGELAEAAGDIAAAERAYQDAVDVLERLNAGLDGGDLQVWSLAKKRRPYARLFALRADRGDSAGAFAVWDRYQRRAFVQTFLPASESGRDVDPSPVAAAQEARQRLVFLSQILPNVTASPVARPVAGQSAGCALPPRWLSGLFYFHGIDHLYVIAVDRGAIRIHRVAEPLDRLIALVARFVANPDDDAVAARLGSLLVPAGAPPASAGGTLFISPAQPLAELPFAALRVRGRRLVEHAALAVIPSLGALDRPRPPSGAAALVLADPGGDLPGARAEADETAAVLGVRALVGGEASRQGLVARRDAGFLHLATHSGVGPRGPWLALSDGPLRADELVGLKLRPRTVVMPTCASAVGTAPGVSPSLAASFLAAGAETVIGALRSVDDGVSRRFVRDFYAAGGAAGDAVGALGRVQRQWARYRPPTEWAAFVALGGAAAPAAPVTRGRQCRLMLAGSHSLPVERSTR